MEMLAHIQEIKLLATLVLGFFCYRSIPQNSDPIKYYDISDEEEDMKDQSQMHQSSELKEKGEEMKGQCELHQQKEPQQKEQQDMKEQCQLNQSCEPKENEMCENQIMNNQPIKEEKSDAQDEAGIQKSLASDTSECPSVKTKKKRRYIPKRYGRQKSRQCGDKTKKIIKQRYNMFQDRNESYTKYLNLLLL